MTPLDDPCQYAPAWRSSVAGWVFDCGVRSEGDFKSLACTGGITVTFSDEDVEIRASNRRGGRRRELRKRFVPIPPFDSSPQYRAFASDKWIMGLVKMWEDKACGRPLAQESVPLKLASRWYEEIDNEAAIKKRIEPLLLTEAGMDVVTMDLVGLPSAQPAFEAYERLYFNCRDDEFKLHPSMQLVQRMAMPWGPLRTFLRKWEERDAEGFIIGDGRPLAKDSDMWRAIAATMGYDVLMYVWNWDRRAHGMKDVSPEHMIELSWKVAVSRMFQDLYNGDIKHEDAARLLAAYTAQAKKISDDRNNSGDADGEDATLALMAVLSAAAPKMRELVAGGEGMITDNDIRSRIESQQAIDKTRIEDKGKAVEAEVIDAQISDAVNR